MDFLKRVLSTITGLFVFLIICFFMLLILVSLGSSGKDSTKIADNTVLELKINHQLLDNSGTVKYLDFPFFDDSEKKGLFYLTNAIKHAATDDRISGISIEIEGINAGITQIKELREALQEFKESGKFITAYGNIYEQKDYYLSSVADSIFLSPVGAVDFRGLSTEILYLKDLQENTGVKMQVVRLGKYKSAVEPFLENEMSAANREQISSYLNSIWNNVRGEIAESRGMEDGVLNKIADDLQAGTPQKAVDVGLIDKLAYYSDYEKSLKNALEIEEDDDIERIGLVKYANNIGSQNHYKYNRNKIAVIYAQGEIAYGAGNVNTIGPKEINKAIIDAKKDKNVKAIVLRVNSPGGSALSSDLIWKELEDAKQEKPLIISMGDYAASGGYYIAAGADRIFAQPSTITGSIGVFGVLPTIKGLADKAGVKAQYVSTNKNSVMYSLFDNLSGAQEDFIRENIIQTYDVFKTRVSDGRGLTMDEVENIAQGRVWTGEEALEIGLVDELGGLDAALEYAAQMAEIEEYQIKELPIYEFTIEDLIRQFSFIKTKEEITKEMVGEEIYELLDNVKTQIDRQGIQLLFPYGTNIK